MSRRPPCLPRPTPPCSPLSSSATAAASPRWLQPGTAGSYALRDPSSPLSPPNGRLGANVPVLRWPAHSGVSAVQAGLGPLSPGEVRDGARDGRAFRPLEARLVVAASSAPRAPPLVVYSATTPRRRKGSGSEPGTPKDTRATEDTSTERHPPGRLPRLGHTFSLSKNTHPLFQPALALPPD